MPKISVKEKDLSWYFRQRIEGPISIYIPLLATFGPSEPTRCDASNFSLLYGSAPVSNASKDISYVMASSLIKSGAGLVVHRIIPDGAAAATAAGDSITVTAKYEGTLGNKIKVKVTGTSDTSVRTVTVSLEGQIVETRVVDFKDTSSKQYFEKVNEDFKYIKLSLTTSNTFDVKKDTDKDLTLTGGLDVTNGEDAYSKVCEQLSKTSDDENNDVYLQLQDLKDPFSLDFDVMCNGGFIDRNAKETSGMSKIDKNLSDVAEGKGTAIYLVDTSSSAEDSSAFYTYCGLFDTSYAAAYGPWCSTQAPYDGQVYSSPASFPFLISWCESCASGNPIWLAPAGVKRAVLSSVKSTSYQVGSAVLDQWQNNEIIPGSGYHVNPIMDLKNYGYTVYGNSTLEHDKSDGSTSMLQSVGTRVMANRIKRKAFEISLGLQFDQFSNDLVNQFTALLSTELDNLRYQNALYDYEIVVDQAFTSDALNTKTLPVIIRISPTPAVENFDITLEISQAGVTFSDTPAESSKG